MLLFQHVGLFTKQPLAIIQLALLICLSSGVVCGNESLEYKVKTAYLYNFTKFISWPAKNTATFNICIVGNDPFNGLLNSLESKTAQGKPIRVFRYSAIRQTSDCHIVYLDDPIPLESNNLLGRLSVSSQPAFAESGGMIGFVLEDEKVKLRINLKALRQSGLVISAKLIEVATLVEGDEHE